MTNPSQRVIVEVPRRHARVEMKIGIDLGDGLERLLYLNHDDEVVDRGRFTATPKAIAKCSLMCLTPA
jgi:hypothetical protein